ncbi:zinc-binding dehydrogenase [Chryseobacterium oranimense]|uniref:zinc-binding dehydrogenase n=1 Tax=Chryseobacterium oranimense TaxID=421058 RepID=UPI0031DEBDFD
MQLAKYLGATVASTASEKSFELLKNLGAEVLIDYKTQDFKDILFDYDVVLNSQDNKTLKKLFNILKPKGKVISISGPPTPAFADEFNQTWYVKFATKLLSSKTRKIVSKQNINYSFFS